MRSSGVTFTLPAEIMAMPRFHATTKLSRRMMDRWESRKLCCFCCTNELFIFYPMLFILTRIGHFTRQSNGFTGDKFECFRAWYKARLRNDSWCVWCNCKERKRKKINWDNISLMASESLSEVDKNSSGG